jgi:23S rRNA pseudouridine1911/1915/1917 synthase
MMETGEYLMGLEPEDDPRFLDEEAWADPDFDKLEELFEDLDDELLDELDDFEAFDFDDEGLLAEQERYEIRVDPGQQLVRIDRYLHDRLPNISRNRVQEAIRQERVYVNEKVVKSNYRVKPGDRIALEVPQPNMGIGIIPEDIPLDIVYEDDVLLVVNKPPGMVVHPGYNNWTGTLVNALAYRFRNLPTSHNGDDKPGIVHRIDKDTSGLLLVAKTEQAMTHLAKQFFNHTCERTYHALVWGHVDEEKGSIVGSIGRDPRNRKLRTVYDDPAYGKHAVTHYEVIRRYRYVTLLKCNLETGRTHQIRVHMRHIGHTLFQDQMYGGDRIMKGERTGRYKHFIDQCVEVLHRQALHAKSLGFVHPVSKEWMQFDSELPYDMAKALEMWEEFVRED